MGADRIAICGKMRSGKSVLAGYLALMHDYQPFAFGDDMKRYYHEIFRVPSDPKPRVGYQNFAQSMRQLDGNVWVSAVERKIADYVKRQCCKPTRILVTDLRQQNEYDWLRANGFTIIRVTAPDELRLVRAQQAGDDFSESDMAHETELLCDTFDVDFTITNEGTTEEMTAQMDAILAEIGVEAV